MKVFGSGHKNIKIKKVMGLANIIGKNKQPEIDSTNQLTTQDLEYLLSTLKNANLRGDQVEQFYNLVIKLQNQYIALTKNS
jgi:hypothetical protein